MNIDKNLFEERCYYEIYHILLKHFQYSIKDISSYEELTSEEKEIIPERIFNQIIKKKIKIFII